MLMPMQVALVDMKDEDPSINMAVKRILEREGARIALPPPGGLLLRGLPPLTLPTNAWLDVRVSYVAGLFSPSLWPLY